MAAVCAAQAGALSIAAVKSRSKSPCLRFYLDRRHATFWISAEREERIGMVMLLGVALVLSLYFGIGLALAFRAAQGDPMRWLRALWTLGLSERQSGGITLFLWVVIGLLLIVLMVISTSFVLRG
jgi:hypothetical protein